MPRFPRLNFIFFLVLIFTVSFANLFSGENSLSKTTTSKIEQKTQAIASSSSSPDLSLDTPLDFNLSLDNLFNQDRKKYAKKTEDASVLVTGDVNLARSVNVKINRSKDYTYPFAYLSDLLKAADLTIINLESPLVKNCPLTDAGMKFCGQTENAKSLALTGVDIASIANNHSNDFGQEGVFETKNALVEFGIKPVENKSLVIQKIKNISFAILGYDLVWHALDEQELVQSVSRAKDANHLVIVFFHWGSEYTSDPNYRQRQLAHLAVDSGADLVLGNHPHWVQAVEIYKDHLIVYSHGNFVFDQLWSQETRRGVVGSYTFSENGKLVDVRFIPIWIDDQYQPTYADDFLSRKILTQMFEASKKLEVSN